MRPGTLNIHFGLPSDSIFLAAFQKSQAIMLILNNVFAQAFDIDTLCFVFSDN